MTRIFSFAAAAVVLFFPVAGFGLGIQIVDQDAEAIGRGNAFAATADNPSAIFYNPAGITQLDGFTARIGGYGIGIHEHYSSFDDGGGVTAKENIEVIPQGYLTYTPKNWPVSFGIGEYSPFGLQLSYPDDTPFRSLAKSGGIDFFTVNPVVAVEVARGFSVAAGLTIDHASTEISQGLPAPLGARGDEFKFKGAGTTLGFNAGVLWQPTPKHSFGVSYHSGVTVDFQGHTTIHLSHEQVAAAESANKQIAAGRAQLAQMESMIMAQNIPPAFKQALIARAQSQFASQLAASGAPASGEFPTSFPQEEADAHFHFPQFIVAGYSFRPTPKWNFEVDVDWTDWDSLNTVTLYQEQRDKVKLPFNWKSSFIYEAGATRYFEKGFRASIGYIYSENSVPESSFTPLVPDSSRHVFSVGIGQTLWKKYSWDVAYQLAYGPSRAIQNGTLADGRYTFLSHAVTVSIGYHF